MTQKNSENIYKALKEEERTLLEKNVTWMEKAFKRKEGYVTFGNAGGELVFCEGEFLSYLEGFQTIILKDGKQIAAYNWKIEDGIKNFQVLCSMKTDKSGKIFFCLIIRGDAPIIVGHTEEIEQESQYNLLIHAWLRSVCLCRRRFTRRRCTAAGGGTAKAVETEICCPEAGTAAYSMHLCPLQSAH